MSKKSVCHFVPLLSSQLLKKKICPIPRKISKTYTIIYSKIQVRWYFIFECGFDSFQEKCYQSQKKIFFLELFGVISQVLLEL